MPPAPGCVVAFEQRGLFLEVPSPVCVWVVRSEDGPLLGMKSALGQQEVRWGMRSRSLDADENRIKGVWVVGHPQLSLRARASDSLSTRARCSGSWPWGGPSRRDRTPT